MTDHFSGLALQKPDSLPVIKKNGSEGIRSPATVLDDILILFNAEETKSTKLCPRHVRTAKTVLQAGVLRRYRLKAVALKIAGTCIFLGRLLFHNLCSGLSRRKLSPDYV
jgi:hypothetical protein